MKNAQAILLVLALAALVLGPTRPAAAQQSALAFLKKRHSAVIQILRKPASSPQTTERRNRELNSALGSLLDFEELSKRALRDHWEGVQKTQREEFVSLLKDLVERNYQKNLESTLDYDVRYDGESPGPDTVVVHTVARSKKRRRAPAIAIDYTLRRAGDGWKVFDVVTDGVSLVRNYRNQFNRIIRRHGWDELIRRMRKRLASGGTGV